MTPRAPQRTAVLLSLIAAGLSVPRAGHAFCIDRNDGSLCHPAITREGLDFLRPDVIGGVLTGVTEADEGTQGISSSVHFDECDFEDGRDFIGNNYGFALGSLDPVASAQFFDGVDSIGRLLHPIQDFYSHTNWIALRRSFTPTDRLSSELGLFPALDEWTTVLEEDILVISGNQVFDDPSVVGPGPYYAFPPGWTIETPAGETVPTVTTADGIEYRGLISGSPDGPGDFGSPFSDCPSGAQLTHEFMNLDNISRFGHCQAAYLAIEQTKMEWCRLLHFLKDEHGTTGPSLALTLLVDPDDDRHLRPDACVPDSLGSSCELIVAYGPFCGPHPKDTPCGPAEYGPIEVSVSVERIHVLDDGDPDDSGGTPEGELNFVLGAYTTSLKQSTRSASIFHTLHAGSVISADDAPQPVTLCMKPDDVIVAAVHAWEDDDPNLRVLNGFRQSDPDDILSGVALEGGAGLAYDVFGGGQVGASSADLDVTFTIARAHTDLDNDGLELCDELVRKLDPKDPDSDDDGLEDGDEIDYQTDPLDADSDDDGLGDGDEVNVHGTNPLVTDTDGDGANDGEEVSVHGTSPVDPDSDDDGLLDGAEIYAHGTDPLDSDTDDDGLGDGFELEHRLDPRDADTDDDGLVDGRDVDWIAAAIQSLPASAVKNPSNANRNAMLNLLADAQALLHKGNLVAAQDKLQALRARIDGCGDAPGRDDWIVHCALQVEIRLLVDLLLDNL